MSTTTSVIATASAPATSARYVFLASNAYSGSTLLSYLLGAHPQVATVSDVSGTRRRGQMDRFRCSCGQLMSECAFWASLSDAARRGGLADFDLADFHLGFDQAGPSWLSGWQARSLRWSALEGLRDVVLRPLGVGRAMAGIGRRNWAFARALLALEEARVFVDASKERMRIRYLQRYLPADLYVIHLVRDVRGVVDSTMRRQKKALSPSDVARRWARTNASILRQLRDVPAERQIRIRYEDLCRDVDGTMHRVFGFCGVDPDARLQPLAGLHLLGNSMRLEAPEEVRLDERWRERLARVVQDEILSAAAPAFGHFYPDASRWQVDGRNST